MDRIHPQMEEEYLYTLLPEVLLVLRFSGSWPLGIFYSQAQVPTLSQKYKHIYQRNTTLESSSYMHQIEAGQNSQALFEN